MQFSRAWRYRWLKFLVWLNKSCQTILIVAVFSFAIAASFYSLLVSKTYEEKRYDSEYYADSIDFISALIQAEAECEEDEEKRHAGYCRYFSELIGDRATLHDLGAQETMALATRGLLKVGMLQTTALYMTLAFLVIAVIQTQRMLREAKASTKAAEATLSQANKTTRLTSETLDVTKDASALQLKPYIAIKFKGVKFSSSEYGRGNTVTLSITVEVTNKGKTPARNLITDFDSAASRIEYKRSRGIMSSMSLVPQTMQPLHEFLIGGDETIPLHFIVECTSAVIGTQYGPENHKELRNKWLLSEVVLNSFNVRYKDIETESTATHKLCKFTVEEDLIGNVPLAGKTRLYEYTTDDDANHRYFMVYAAPD